MQYSFDMFRNKNICSSQINQLVILMVLVYWEIKICPSQINQSKKKLFVYYITVKIDYFNNSDALRNGAHIKILFIQYENRNWWSLSKNGYFDNDVLMFIIRRWDR